MHRKRRQGTNSPGGEQGTGCAANLSRTPRADKEGKRRQVFVCFKTGTTDFATAGRQDYLEIWSDNRDCWRPSAYVSAQLCQPSGGKRRRFAIRSGNARARRSEHYSSLHTRCTSSPKGGSEDVSPTRMIEEVA